MRHEGAVIDGQYQITTTTWAMPPVDPMLAETATFAVKKWTAEPSQITMRKWLGSLAMLTAGRLPTEEAVARTSTYADMLDHIPAAILTRDCLKRAALAFKWFPSFAEVGEFLQVEADTFAELRRRLAVIAGLDGGGKKGA